MKRYFESIGNPHKKNTADPIESASESETENDVYGESHLPTAKAASFRLNHPWVVEVKEGYLCGLCHDASQTKKLNLETGTKYFVDKVCGRKLQPGRKAVVHEKDSRHIQLASNNQSIGAYIKETTEKLAKQKSADKEKYISKYLDQAYFLFKEKYHIQPSLKN